MAALVPFGPALRGQDPAGQADPPRAEEGDGDGRQIESQPAKREVITDPADPDRDLAIQGEYAGMLDSPRGQSEYGVQVVSAGDGLFHAEIYKGGLPGAGWRGRTPQAVDGGWNGDVVELREIQKAPPMIGKTGEGTKVGLGGAKAVGRKLEGLEGDPARVGLGTKDTGPQKELLLAIKEGQIHYIEEGKPLGILRKVTRESPTLGQAPPEGAVVLFDGTSAAAFADGQLTAEQLLKGGCVSRQSFGDHSAHFEYRLPYMPYARGWKRAPSGVVIQNRYRVALLDSMGMAVGDHGNGGIPGVARQLVNVSFPPLTWQTLDYDFRAPRFDAEGNKTAHGRLTVRLNGVLIHEDVELDRSKRFRGQKLPPFKESPAPGPIQLEGGSKTVFRNIWVVPAN